MINYHIQLLFVEHCGKTWMKNVQKACLDVLKREISLSFSSSIRNHITMQVHDYMLHLPNLSSSVSKRSLNINQKNKKTLKWAVYSLYP